ncbi:sulfatase-like hydrolase/transferase [Candidatus Leptofilum sp.]|uniref:sulfatase-like hydrolase/transferase n=1 Tax=Candidatus Leptofilum sp. TaxID=3241576 RepID=UPI003B5C9006
MKKSFTFHPILFAIFPALSIVADHIDFLTINETVLIMMGGTVILASIALLFFRWLWHDNDKAAVFVSLSLLLFFSYGHIFDYMTKTLAINQIQHRHLAAVWLVLYLLLFFILWRTKKSLALLSKWLTLTGTILVLFSLLPIIFQRANEAQAWRGNIELTSNQAPNQPPDIYYIILDAYAHPETLQTFYGFDNQPFLQGLTERGFYVAENSHSNYALTSLSLSSSLNMSYVNEISNLAGEDSVSIALPMQMIEDNNVVTFLQSQGYNFVFMGSGYGVSQANRYATRDVRCGLVDETGGRFIATSLLRAPADRFRLVEQDDRQRRLCMFAELARMPRQIESPTFVFAHVPSPHWPFLFDEEGNPVVMENLSQAELKQGYLNQLIFLNGRMTQIVDSILKHSDQEPIIIIQSDHGPAFETSMDTPSITLYQERMRILNAYYLPAGSDVPLYDTISPINSFRVLFNHFFATELPLLEDRSYFSNYESPYKFTDVTDQLHSN